MGAKCPLCPVTRRPVNLTAANTFYAHKPYTRKYSGEFVLPCPAGGLTIREAQQLKEKNIVTRKVIQRDGSHPCEVEPHAHDQQ